MDQLVNALNAAGAGFCRYAGAMFVQTAVLVAVLLVVDLLIRKRVRAALRYWMWMLVFVKLVLPPTLALPTGVGYWLKLEAPKAEAATEAPLPPSPALERLLPTTAPVLPPVPTYMPVDVAPATNAPVEPSIPVVPVADPGPALTWQAAVFVLWLVGLLVFGLLLIQRAFFVRGLVAQSVPAGEDLQMKLERCAQQVGAPSDVELRISPNTFSPAVCGLLRPTILIPASLLKHLSADNLRAVLIHELAHIKRGDLGMNFAQTILQVIYFYNPLIWLAGALVRKVREKAVDEMVLVALGAEAKSYSRTLIDIAEMTFFKANLALRLIGVAESKRSLEGRIKHMLTRPIPRTAKVGFWGVLALAAAGAVLLPMAQGQNIRANATVVTESFDDEPSTDTTDVSARLTSAQNLSGLGKAVLLYANDYRGRLPDRLWDRLWDLAEVEMHPSLDSWLQENVAYLGQGMTVDDAPGRPVAFDRTLLAQGQGTNVLYLDSHVAFETPETLKKMGIESGGVDRTEALRRLRELALAVEMYTQDEETTRLPDNINTIRDYLNDDALAVWLQINAEYLGKRMQTTYPYPADRPVAYIKTGLRPTQGMNVVFLDGHAEYLSPERLTRSALQWDYPRLISQQQLTHLGVAILSYAADHNARLPDTLAEARDYIEEVGDYMWVAENVVYQGKGMSIGDPPETAVAYYKNPIGEGMNALHLDGHVQTHRALELSLLRVGAASDEQATSRRMLSSLGKAMLIYAHDFRGRLPDRPLDLIEVDMHPSMVSWLQENVAYLGQGMTVDDDPSRPVAFDRTLLAQGQGTNVLYLDSHVAFETPETLKQMGIESGQIDRTEAMTRLRRLAVALLLYADDNDSRLPDSINAARLYFNDDAMLIWLQANVQYIGQRMQISDAHPDRQAIAYVETGPIATEGAGVAFLDGHVEFASPARLETLGIDTALGGAISSASPSEAAARRQSSRNLGALGRASLVYAGDHDDTFPDSLSDLTEVDMDPAQIQWLQENVVYLGRGATTSDQPDRPLAYDKTLLAQGKGTNVLYLDSHVEFVRLDELRNLGIATAPDRAAPPVSPSEATARIQSATNLRGLGKASLVYANDHEDRFPDHLSDLTEVDMAPAQIQWLQENAVYLGRGATTSDRPDRLVAYDKTLLAQGQGTNVLYLDSHVAFETPDRLEQLGIKENAAAASAARDWLEGFWITFVPHSPIRNLGEYQQAVRISFTRISLPNEPAALPAAELEIRRAADHAPVARVPFAASEQGRAPLATLMRQSVGTLPDGQYLAAFCLGNTRCSNVARLTIDSQYAPDSEPVMTLVPLPSPPSTNAMLVGIRAIGRNPIDPELTNEAVAFAPLFVDGTERRPETMKWVGGIGPVQPNQQEVRILDLGQYAPAIDPGRAHRIRARIGGFESPSVVLLTTDDFGGHWDEATGDLTSHVPGSAILGTAATGAVREPGGRDILERMRSLDTAFLQSSTIVAEARSSIVEQQQVSPGEKIETITIVLDGSGIAMDRRVSFTEMPAYREPTAVTAGDYGPDGSLIVWRPTRERGLMQSAFQGYRTDLTSILVSPNGEITRQPSGTSAVDLYRPDDMQRYSWFWSPVLATGRGFSPYLRDVVAVEETENGLIRIEARGVSHLGVELTWDLVIDPQANYLVRSASYAYDGGRFDFSSTGTKRFGSQVLAGQADFGPNLAVEIKDYRGESDSEILAATEGAFRQPLPEGARVMDWTAGQASLSL